ncbi:CidA/LrgA family protein [Bacillus sp. MRMR6]|uniref:CidA/LrgA family protein n=1 Tax=Bacillus sp. MRMR6 TaxID=1928617 RepID=UPI000951D505|nr:CidA/LrgA family protein [Bacillus sp. MRMR6]OLS39855.1 murein hydrolase regulator LrgA [Bacillus sp. MRMR6]
MKRISVFIMQLIVLILIYHLGNDLARILHIKIPGNVIGMLILLLLFWLKIIKVEQIEVAAGWLLKHLGFFFIPISVGLMTLGDTIKRDGFILLIILLISAIIGLIASGKVTQSLIEKKEEVNNHDHVI